MNNKNSIKTERDFNPTNGKQRFNTWVIMKHRLISLWRHNGKQ